MKKTFRARAVARIESAQATFALTVRQRCFYLFCALLLVFVAVPFLEDTPRGRLLLNAINLSVLVAGAAAIGRGPGTWVLGLLLALPAAGLQAAALLSGRPHLLVLSWAFSAAFYFLIVSHLLTYVLRREVLSVDKLYGAAATFLMMAALWTYFYGILLVFYPGALSINGAPVDAVPFSTLLYFSVATITATGMSDIMPVHPIARMLCSLEMITGVLFIAVLIARLAGSYQPAERAR